MVPRSATTMTIIAALMIGTSVHGLLADDSLEDDAFEPTRLAITDLIETFGQRYPKGPEYLTRLNNIKQSGDVTVWEKLAKLKREALLANPLLDFKQLVLLKRKRGQLGLPVNHKCNSGIEQTGYDNEIALLTSVRGKAPLRTLFRPKGSQFVGEFDLHFDGDRLLFTMPSRGTWQIWEINVDGRGLRQVSKGKQPDVDNFDPCYLPDGGIVFASTASYHAVPCWHGIERACGLFRMNGDGTGMRQLCFDQDLDLHPAVLSSGQVVYSRWDYSGPLHMYLRPLMVMNPDGTGQRALYGSNSYWPNALYYPRGIPGSPNKLVAIAAGYHGVPRMGELVVIDLAKGRHEEKGIVQRIPGRNKPIEPIIRDNLVKDSWPKYLHPFPLNEKYFLVAAQLKRKSPWGIYLVDVFDNIVPVRVNPKYDFFEPLPVAKSSTPPAIADRVDLKRDDAVVYVHNLYQGPGLKGVPKGTIKRLRLAAYEFGYPGMAGPDKIGCGGPWEAMKILGTVPVYEDGSASFRIPANTPLTIQPLDEEGKAVQLMRTWYTAMPGERVSCVGCHEESTDTAAPRYDVASSLKPVDITPWYGPARGFDFEREVQPVLNQHCASCHDGQPREDKRTIPDLRSEKLVKQYAGRPLSDLGARRLHPDMRRMLGGTSLRYTPAYEALLPYIRRVNVEDDVHLLVPGEYHADTSELIQMLKKGHHGVKLKREGWDRLVTWIDLNGPCHGSWDEVCTVPDGAVQRRRELEKEYGGSQVNSISLPIKQRRPIAPVRQMLSTEKNSTIPKVTGWPFSKEEAQRRQAAQGAFTKTIDLGDGISLKLTRVPAGEFVMGSVAGKSDERPLAKVALKKDYWIGECEITNEQFRQFNSGHDSRLFTKRYQGSDGPGLSLNEPKQPAVRVSWQQAMAFCQWLSKKTGSKFTLPSEAQWEYACRAGHASEFSYGGINTDFSPWANVADKALSLPPRPTGGLESNITAHHGVGVFLSAIYGGNILCDHRFDDHAIATSAVGSYRPNAWGLYDMHGNVAEWTRDSYLSYSYAVAGQSDGEKKVVRGGSWVDRPERCRSAFRLNYPSWQRVHNVGFRVVGE